jgi:endoglucanase
MHYNLKKSVHKFLILYQKMKKYLVYLIVFVVGFAAACTSEKTATVVEPLPAIKVSGNVFVNENGDVVRLQGVSYADPDKLERDGQWDIRIFEESKSWGSNVVRFAIHPYTWRYRGANEYLELLDKGVELATQTGQYVIIDWHSIGNMVEDVYPHFNYATSWRETVNFWKLIAERYKGNTTVALFELFNEPTAQGAPLSWKTWKPVMENLIDEINAVDDSKIYLVAGMDWAYLLDEVVENPVNRANVAYVSHPYPQKREQPWEPQWEADFGHVAQHYPIVATEFGFVIEGERGQHIPVIGDETYGEAIMNFFEERGISYTLWCFDPLWSPAMFEDWNFTPSRQGRFFKQVMQRNL